MTALKWKSPDWIESLSEPEEAEVREFELQLMTGHGPCTSDGCECPMFDGEFETCGVCGHHASMHA